VPHCSCGLVDSRVSDLPGEVVTEMALANMTMSASRIIRLSQESMISDQINSMFEKIDLKINLLIKKSRNPKRRSLLREFRLLPKILRWMGYSLSDESRPSMSEWKSILSLTLRILKILQSSGPVETISFCKLNRQALLNYLSGNPCKIPGVRLTKDGIPVVLGDLISTVRGLSSAQCSNYTILSLINTILWSSRSLKSEATLDTKSITMPSASDGELYSDMELYLKDFTRSIGVRPSQRVPQRVR
jgi:hypothetical protein